MSNPLSLWVDVTMRRFLIPFLLGILLPIGLHSTGMAWSTVRSPDVPRSNYDELDGVAATSPTDAWAVGFSRVSSPFRANIEHFNGRVWTIVAPGRMAPGIDTRLHAVTALSAENVWAVGSQSTGKMEHGLIEHWNGMSWSVVPEPADEPRRSELVAVFAVSDADIWAVGSTNPSNASTDTLIEHWNGTSWMIVAGASLRSTPSYLRGVDGSSADDLWAVGSSGRHSTPILEHWNGKVWTEVSQPVTGYDSSLNAVSVVSSSDAWAVGEQNLSQTVTEHWNGKVWSVVPSPHPASDDAQNTLTGLSTFGPADAWAVGYTFNGSATNMLTEHWNGNAWSLVSAPSPVPDYYFAADVGGSVAGQPLWAVGARGTDSGPRNLALEATA